MKPPPPASRTADTTHGPVLGPAVCFLVALLTIAVAAVIRRQHLTSPEMLPWLFFLPVTLAGPAAAAIYVLGCRHHAYPASVRFWLYNIGGGTAWATWTIWRWGHSGMIVTTLAALVATGYAMATAPEFAPPTSPVAAPPVPLVRREEQQWETLINKICNIQEQPGIHVQSITPWPNRAGYRLTTEFPLGSPHSFRLLQDHAADLAAAKRLPNGCVISATAGAHQGAALLHVATVNDTSVIDFPTDYWPQSITQQFPIGAYTDQDPTMVEVYQSSAMIAGMRGAGKTVLLNVLTARLLCCTEPIVIHVDLNGGGMSAPWLMPYATGQLDEPPIYWVARNAEEALIVAEVLTAIAKDRKARYQRLRVSRNVDVLPVSAELPAIVVIVDEGGEVFGGSASKTARQAAAALQHLQAIGRAECVNVIFSTQRGTATYIPSDVRKATALKIVGMVEDDSEIAYVMDWSKGLRVSDINGPDPLDPNISPTGFIRYRGSVPRKFRWYRLLPEQMIQIALATQGRRPEMDAAALRIGGDVMATRWDRARPWLQALAGVEPDVDEAAAYVAPEPALTVGDAANIADRIRAKLRGEAQSVTALSPPARPAKSAEDDLPEEWRTTAAQLAALPTTVDNDDATDQTGVAFVLDLIRGAGPEGVRTGTIFTRAQAAGLTRRRATISRWIKELCDEGKVARAEQYATWVSIDHATR